MQVSGAPESIRSRGWRIGRYTRAVRNFPSRERGLWNYLVHNQCAFIAYRASLSSRAERGSLDDFFLFLFFNRTRVSHTYFRAETRTRRSVLFFFLAKFLARLFSPPSQHGEEERRDASREEWISHLPLFSLAFLFLSLI